MIYFIHDSDNAFSYVLYRIGKGGETMRDLKIIEELLYSEQYRSIEYLSKLLDVSTRTIRNDLKYLQKLGETNGFSIHQKRKSGFRIEIIDEALFQKYREGCEQCIPYVSTDRIFTIIAYLLMRKEYLTQEMLADNLNVSKSIIKVDMGKVEEHLYNHQIELLKKAHYGQKVECSLLQRVLYLSELYEQGNPYLVSQVDKGLKETAIRKLEKDLIRILKEFHLETNYVELKKLDIFLKISVFLSLHNIGSEKEELIEEEKVYKNAAIMLEASIREHFPTSLSKEMIGCIARYLKQKTKPAGSILLYNQELKEEVEWFLDKVDKKNHTTFNEDEEFKKSLLAHVSLLIDRLHQQISFSNPMVHEISVKYPVVFNICIQFADMLEEKYHVKATRDEIGFIATHFAAHMEKELHQNLNSFERIAIVCSSGGGSAFLIKLKMESVFPSSKIQTFSMLEMEELHQYYPDIIFTICQLDEHFDVPVILIKELLDDEDIRNIKSMFEFGKFYSSTNEKPFGSLFRKDAFYVFDRGTYKELIENMGKDLEKHAYCEKGYAEYVMEREHVLSTVYQNGVAIPHPVEMCGKESMISVGLVQTPMVEEGKDVKLIFMVNLKKGDLKFHQNITRVLFDVMQDGEFVEMLRHSETFEDFVRSINQIHLEGGKL